MPHRGAGPYWTRDSARTSGLAVPGLARHPRSGRRVVPAARPAGELQSPAGCRDGQPAGPPPPSPRAGRHLGACDGRDGPSKGPTPRPDLAMPMGRHRERRGGPPLDRRSNRERRRLPINVVQAQAPSAPHTFRRPRDPSHASLNHPARRLVLEPTPTVTSALRGPTPTTPSECQPSAHAAVRVWQTIRICRIECVPSPVRG
jgi:hypothetical protein